MKTQATAKLKNIRISPRKARLVVDLIRGRAINDAMIQLEFCQKHAAKPVLKLLKSAIANAIHNHNMDQSTLTLKSVMVDGGATLHRFKARAMGRAFKIRKRTSHISIVIEGDEVEKKEIKKASSKKEEANTAESKE